MLIAIFTICIGSLTFGEGLNYMHEEKEEFQYLSQGTLLAGIGITETIVGIFTFRGKGVGIEIQCGITNCRHHMRHVEERAGYPACSFM